MDDQSKPQLEDGTGEQHQSDTFEIDEVDLPNVNDEEIYLEHCRIKCISKLSRFPNVRSLCLRNNLLKKLENFEPISQTLEDLDVYDNQITKVNFSTKCE